MLELGGEVSLPARREATRSQLALILTLSVSLIAVMLVVFLAANLLTSDETKELAATVLSPIVAVTGAALGFYFGGHRTGGLALPEPSSGETS